MSRDPEDRTPEEGRVEEILKGLPSVAADPEFRERLRAEFRSGQVAGRRGGKRWPWAAAASVVIAAGAAIVFFESGSAWTVIVTGEAGSVVVDGRRFDAADSQEFADLLLPGALLETDARTELQLVRDDTIALVVTPDTAMRVPAVPGRWLSRTTSATVERGEVRGVTGKRFAGARLRIELPDASVNVTGTVFAVFRNAEGSCVCVLEGLVEMQDATGVVGVAPLRRRVIPPHGEPPREEPIRPMEQMKLEMLRDQARAAWARDDG